MHSAPSKTAEAIVAFFIPSECREEILGDLHERYRSPGQYACDAMRTVPLVIISRLRRTADLQTLLMQSFAAYASFLVAAWLRNRAFLSSPWGLVRLAIPAVFVLIGLLLDGVYAKPEKRLFVSLTRGPVIGLRLALASQIIFRITAPDWAVPGWIAIYGCALSLLLSSAVRLLFPPSTGQIQEADVPAIRLGQSGGTPGSPGTGILTAMSVTATIASAITGTSTEDREDWAVLPKSRMATLLLLLLLVLLIVRLAWK